MATVFYLASILGIIERIVAWNRRGIFELLVAAFIAAALASAYWLYQDAASPFLVGSSEEIWQLMSESGEAPRLLTKAELDRRVLEGRIPEGTRLRREQDAEWQDLSVVFPDRWYLGKNDARTAGPMTKQELVSTVTDIAESADHDSDSTGLEESQLRREGISEWLDAGDLYPDVWYVKMVDGSTSEPYTKAEIDQRVSAGLVVGDEQLRREGDTVWCSVRELYPELWFLKTANEKVFGPLAKAELDQLVADGRLRPNCQIRTESDANWRQVNEIYPELGDPWRMALITAGIATTIGLLWSTVTIAVSR
jgi:hypothetical protein